MSVLSFCFGFVRLFCFVLFCFFAGFHAFYSHNLVKKRDSP